MYCSKQLFTFFLKLLTRLIEISSNAFYETQEDGTIDIADILIKIFKMHTEHDPTDQELYAMTGYPRY